jgi:hypothetical protein
LGYSGYGLGSGGDPSMLFYQYGFPAKIVREFLLGVISIGLAIPENFISMSVSWEMSEILGVHFVILRSVFRISSKSRIDLDSAEARTVFLLLEQISPPRIPKLFSNSYSSPPWS